MAKRAAPDEQPYRPLLDAGLVSAAIAQVASKPAPAPLPEPQANPVRNVSSSGGGTSRPELIRRVEMIPVNRGETVPALENGYKTRESPNLTVDKFDHEKRILFTRTETESIDRMVTSLARRLNAQVKVSHIIRALVSLVLNAEGEIDKRAGEGVPLVRPHNGDAQALQKFERDIARILAAAFRDAPLLRP